MQTKRNAEIDLFRLVFSIIIVFYHFNSLYDFELFPCGNICVEFFFIVSGYLAATQAERIKADTPCLSLGETAGLTWRLVIKKIAPLYGYYVSAIIVQTVIRDVMVKQLPPHELFLGFLRSIPTFTLTFMGLNKSSMSFYVGNTWFISAMIIAMFILYPLILKSYRFSSRIVCPLLTLFLLGYSYTKYGSVIKWEAWDVFCYTGIIRALCAMSFGISLRPLAAIITERLGWLIESRRVVLKLALTTVKFFCYGVVISYAAGVDFGEGFNLYSFFFFGAGILMSFVGAGYTLPQSKAASLLGRISLPIYIYHGFIKSTCRLLFPKESVGLYGVLAMVAASIAISLVLMLLTDLTARLFKKLGGMIRKYA